MKDKNEFTFDVRVVERCIREGAITKEDYEEHLEQLPDVADKGRPLIVDKEAREESKVDLENKEEETAP